MAQRIQAPDGSIVEFPDGMTDAQIAAVMRKEFGGPKPARQAQQRPRSLVDNVTGFMANVNRGLMVGDEIAGAIQAAPAIGRNVLAAGQAAGRGDFGGARNALAQVPQSFREGMAAQRGIEDDFRARNPNAAALAVGTGNALSAVVPGAPGTNALVAGTRGVNMARGATTAALGASTYGALDRGTVEERARAATDPGTLAVAGVLGAGASALAPTAPRQPRTRPAADQRARDVALLNQEGVQMTPGQIQGGVRQTAEDAGTSLPMVGDAIQSRRAEGVKAFNRANLNRTLREIGETLPDSVETGTDAVRYAGDIISRGYDDLIPNRTIRADPGFADDVRAAFANVDTLTPQSQRRLGQILDQRITSRLGEQGTMDGQLYKTIQSELDFEVSRFKGAGDPDARAIGEVLEGVQSALEAAAVRQDPAFGARMQSLDRAWSELARIEDAAARATDLSGIYTPKQYSASIRAGDSRVRRRGVARGEALNQEFAGAAARILPAQMPDSGTAGRSMWGLAASVPGAVVGAATGGGPGALAGIAGTGATLAGLSRLYTPEAVEAANRALSAQVASQAQQQAVEELRQIALRSPQAMALYRRVIERLAPAVGEGAAASRAPTVEAYVVGRPELGVGRSYGPAGQGASSQ